MAEAAEDSNSLLVMRQLGVPEEATSANRGTGMDGLQCLVSSIVIRQAPSAYAFAGVKRTQGL
jgi:hypothetical protein